jgi:hypothetical protein
MQNREEVHKGNFRRWVDTQQKRNAKQKEGRSAALSSVKEELTHKMIHTIEGELKDMGVKPMRTSFTGFKAPWKR